LGSAKRNRRHGFHAPAGVCEHAATAAAGCSRSITSYAHGSRAIRGERSTSWRLNTHSTTLIRTMQTTTALETDTQKFPTKNSHARISPAASLLTRERRARHTGVAILGVCREAHLTCRTAGEIAAAKEAHRSARLPRPDGPGGGISAGFRAQRALWREG